MLDQYSVQLVDQSRVQFNTSLTMMKASNAVLFRRSFMKAPSLIALSSTCTDQVLAKRIEIQRSSSLVWMLAISLWNPLIREWY